MSTENHHMRLATLLLILLLPATAAARWPSGSTERLAAHAQIIADAAGEHGLDQGLLGALLVYETGVQGIQGASADVWGAGQVAAVHIPRLIFRGYLSPGDGPEELLDVPTGIMCAAAVLGDYQRRIKGRSRHLVLSDYAMGAHGARDIQTDSEYSRGVVFNLVHVRSVLAAGLAMRSLCGPRSAK